MEDIPSFERLSSTCNDSVEIEAGYNEEVIKTTAEIVADSNQNRIQHLDSTGSDLCICQATLPGPVQGAFGSSENKCRHSRPPSRRARLSANPAVDKSRFPAAQLRTNHRRSSGQETDFNYFQLLNFPRCKFSKAITATTQNLDGHVTKTTNTTTTTRRRTTSRTTRRTTTLMDPD